MDSLKQESDKRHSIIMLEDENAVIIQPKGVIVLTELIECFNHLKRHSSFNYKLNYFIDIRSVKYTGDVEQVKKFVCYVREHFTMSLDNRISFLTESMEQIALASMFKMLQDRNLKNLRFFTEMEDALLWTGIGKSESEIENLILGRTNFCS